MDADRVRTRRLGASAGEPQRAALGRNRVRLVRRQPHRRAGAVPAPRAADPPRPVLSVRPARTAARSLRRCDWVRRRSRAGGLVERSRHVRIERVLRRGRGPWLRPGAGARAPCSSGRRRCHGVRLRPGGGHRSRPTRLSDRGADGRNAAGLRGSVVRAGGRAPDRARRRAVGADEGCRPRRRSPPGGLRHSARRARPGARRSHPRDRLLARSRLLRLGGTVACAAGGGVGPQGHPCRPRRQADRGAGARRGGAGRPGSVGRSGQGSAIGSRERAPPGRGPHTAR